MSFSKKFFAFLFCVFFLQNLWAQDRALGTWKSFMPYGVAVAVCDAEDFVYCAGTKSIFSYEKSSGTIQTYDKATGLSDIGIKTIAYDPSSKALVVAYNNSNLDLIFNGTDVYNISDIKNESTSGAVNINGISFYNGKAYISTDMGISVVDLGRKEISETYVIGSTGGQVKVFSTSTNGNTIYAATDEGVKHAAYNSANLQNFNNWTLFDTDDSLPKKKASFVAVRGSKAYTVISDSLFEYNGSKWSRIYFENNFAVKSLNEFNGSLYFSAINTSALGAGRLGKIDASGTFSVTVSDYNWRPFNWFESSGSTWVADEYSSLEKITGSNRERITPDGPGTASVSDIAVEDGVVYVATGGADESWGPVFNFEGFFVYKNNTWTTHNQSSDAVLSSFKSIFCTASPAGSSKAYFGSFLDGLLEYDKNSKSMVIYDQWNSILESPQVDPTRTKISCLHADKNNNLWIGNADISNPAVKVLKPNGDWKKFSIPYSFALMKKILIDQNGQLWAPVRRNGEGLLVWSNNGTEDDPGDDVSRLLLGGSGAGGLPDPICYDLAEDKDGNIWVGTNQGIGIFYCPGSVLNTNGCDADQIKVERDGYIGYLFGTESVRAIAVDAANRKWIGTTNGLWLISADGKTELLKFTKDNSPLPDNQITKISIDEKTGEVFIGTIGGLVSYQGDAIAVSDEEKAFVYPNPVQHEYEGPIAIKGLVEDAYVKITDITGTLIYQGKANGTQMVWNGKGYKGDRAKSGVYLVFSSTDLGKEKQVAKILLLN